MIAKTRTQRRTRYYVKSCDADGEFVREIVVDACSAAEALAVANEQRLPDEVSLGALTSFAALESQEDVGSAPRPAPQMKVLYRWYFATYSVVTGERLGQQHVSAVTEAEAVLAVHRLVGDDVLLGDPVRYLPAAAY